MADSEIRALLTELERFGQENDAQQTDRAHKMLNLETPTAQLINLLVRVGKRRSVLEIGTSNGYSTIWLAWALRETGGHLISVDRDPEKHRQAEENLRRAGLRDQVELHAGDATEIVTMLPGPFECVFFDADRFSAPAQLAILLPKMTSDALVLADNVLSHPEEISAYLAAVQSNTEFDHMVVPVGKGLSLAYRHAR